MLEETAKTILKTKEWRGLLIPSPHKQAVQTAYTEGQKTLRDLGPIGRLLLDRGEITNLTLPPFTVLEINQNWEEKLRAFTLTSNTIKLVRVAGYMAMEIKFAVEQHQKYPVTALTTPSTYWPTDKTVNIDNFIANNSMSIYMFPTKTGYSMVDNKILLPITRYETIQDITYSPYLFKPPREAANTTIYSHYGEKDFNLATINYLDSVLQLYKQSIASVFPDILPPGPDTKVASIFALTSQKKMISKRLANTQQF